MIFINLRVREYVLIRLYKIQEELEQSLKRRRRLSVNVSVDVLVVAPALAWAT